MPVEQHAVQSAVAPVLRSAKQVIYNFMVFSFPFSFNPLPDDKVLDWSKLKTFADDKINVTKELKSGLEREENIVGKGENAGNQHIFSFSQNVFERLLSQGCLKSGLCGKGLILWPKTGPDV